MKSTLYIPRLGSKVDAAVQALQNGPMHGGQLAAAIHMAKGDLPATLAAAIDHGCIIRVQDQDGLMHYALGGQVLDERFTAYDEGGEGTSTRSRGRALTGAPLVRSVTKPSVSPWPEALTVANLFRRRPAPQAESQPEAKANDSGQSAAATANAEQGRQVKIARRRAPLPTAPAVNDQEQLVAGLFNNGELAISVGSQYIKLNPAHTRQLFDYLDKITGMICTIEERAH